MSCEALVRFVDDRVGDIDGDWHDWDITAASGVSVGDNIYALVLVLLVPLYVRWCLVMMLCLALLMARERGEGEGEGENFAKARSHPQQQGCYHLPLPSPPPWPLLLLLQHPL